MTLLASSDLLAIFSVPWLKEASTQSLPPSSHFYLVYMSVSKFPLLIRTLVIYKISFNLIVKCLERERDQKKRKKENNNKNPNNTLVSKDLSNSQFNIEIW